MERLLYVASNLPHAQAREVAATQVLCLYVNRPVWQEVFTVSSPIINIKKSKPSIKYWTWDVPCISSNFFSGLMNMVQY
jgi:hypothetical protein